jgi:hypothetical protein
LWISLLAKPAMAVLYTPLSNRELRLSAMSAEI